MFFNIKAKGLGDRLWFLWEKGIKVPIFGCSMCGQCILRSTGLVCPMGCPKQLRNGPCGGCLDGLCEVYRHTTQRPCAWYQAVTRAQRLPGRKAKLFRWTEKLHQINPKVDWRLWNTSSWLNIKRKLIDWDGHPLPPPETK